jgi:hypothetical protein
MLSEFPPEYSEEQKIRDDDFIKIVEYGIPQKWKAEMVRQSYVPTDHHLVEFTEFCEKLEVTEQMLDSSTHKNGKEQGSKPKDEPDGADNHSGSLRNAKMSHGRKNKGKIVSFVDSDGKDGCAYHIHANGHTTKNCTVLLEQAKKMRNQQAAQHPKKKTNNYHDNGGYKKKSSGDFHALLSKVENVTKSLKKAMEKQEKKAKKKRSREDYDSDEDTDKNFEPDSFHLNLEELSINDETAAGADDEACDMDWGDNE